MTQTLTDGRQISTATETEQGVVIRATDIEAAAGTDTEKYVSSKQVKDKIDDTIDNLGLAPISRAFDVQYQAATSGFITGVRTSGSGDAQITCFTGPVSATQIVSVSKGFPVGAAMAFVPAGYFYKVEGANGGSNTSVDFYPLS